MKNIVIDMRDFNITGDILDVSVKGNAIISEFIKTSDKEVEKDFMVLNYKDNVSGESTYDNALAFFTLSSINGRRRLDRSLEEIKRLLKKDGKIIIWDVHTKGIKDFGKRNIKVTLKDEKEIILPFRVKINPFRVNFVDLIKFLENNKYKVLSSVISGDSYYIEALNTKEARDENLTLSFKRKIYTFLLGNKIFKKLFKGVQYRDL